MIFLIAQQYSEFCKQPLDVLKSYKIMHPVENLVKDLWPQSIHAAPPTESVYSSWELILWTLGMDICQKMLN